ncbi:MAG: IS21 family transposase [Candidatus Dormibacteraeota bacterium]|nr:IS21 family transposase [Candidatus Dormibacteraeota bacterium]
MGNYLKMSSQQQIETLLELGWPHRRIARELGVHRETVGRYARLRTSKPAKPIAGSEDPGPREGPDQKRPNPIPGPEDRREEQNRPNPITGPPSPAAAHHEYIEKGLKRGLTAQRIWQDLVEQHGYNHGYLSVQRYARRLKRRHPELADHMEHPPGDEAQIDFFKSKAPICDPRTGRRIYPWVFRMTLSCSRHGYEEALRDQKGRSFMRAHEHAFLQFGGVPRVVRMDNTKTAVTRACFYDPDLNEQYEAFAEHWGFIPLPSRPRHPQEQGIQERSGGYVNDNALKGRSFESLDDLNKFLRGWNRRVAQQRIHGSTRRQVLAHFLEVEQPALRPLPGERFQLFETGRRRVHFDGYVEVDSSYYTAPDHLVGQWVRVRWDERLVRIHHEGQLVRVHAKRHRPGSWATDRADRPDHKPARQEAYQANLLARAEHVGANALAWARAAIVERDVRSYRLLQGMLALTRKHPRECVDHACAVALQSGSFRYKTLKRLVELEVERRPPPTRRLTQEHALIRPLSDYAVLTTAGAGS